MAVLVEAISIIIKAEAIVDCYPGGWLQFEANPPNKTLCADRELIRVGFMIPDDVSAFIESLSEFGIQYLVDGKAVDLVVVDQQRGFAAPCDWATFGRGPLGGNENHSVAGCRRMDSNVTQLVFPDGWIFEGSLSDQFKFVETGRVQEYMDYLRTEDGLDVYRDIRSGKEVFVPEQQK